MSTLSDTLKITKALLIELKDLPANVHRNRLHGLAKRYGKLYVKAGHDAIEENLHGVKIRKGYRMANDIIYK